MEDFKLSIINSGIDYIDQCEINDIFRMMSKTNLDTINIEELREFYEN